MIHEVKLPQYGMGMQDGMVLKYFKREGDSVRAGEPLVEVEAAKTIVEVPAPVDGVLRKILIEAGRTVPVLEVLAHIEAEGDTATRAVQIEPRAQKLARDAGLDVATLSGSGPAGRIVAADVQRAIEQRSVGAANTTALPLTGMRGTIARRMLASLQTTAQLTLTAEADVTALVALRDGARAGEKFGYNDVLVRATALALQSHPRLNATIDAQGIQVHRSIHVGIAVALEEGLVVPVVRDADRKTLREIAAETRTLVERARSGSLTPAETQGATFSTSNLGAFGIDAFTPVLNPPEVALLGFGRIREQFARVAAGPTWRHCMTLSLTIDHRAVDGVPAAAFLETLCGLLADPQRLVS